MPKIQKFTFKIVFTNEQADELAAEGLDFRSRYGTARDRLDKGAIAFCVFVERELAHITWLAMTQEAKDSLYQPPYAVDFSKAAVLGRADTYPKYRRMGIWGYVHLNIVQFLKKRGIVAMWAPVGKSNIASQNAMAKFNSKIYAEARYLRILWWKSWKEKIADTG